MNYLIYGTSFRLIDEEIEKILNGHPSSNYYLSDTPLNTIIEDISYGSMFNEEKYIIIKDFDSIVTSKKDNDSALEILEKYLEDPNEFTTIIFISKEKISSKGALKNIVKLLKVIETPIITKPYELSKLLDTKIRKEGYGISQNALNIFTEKCATNYDIAINEYEKLKEIKGENSLISEDDIEKFVSNYNMSDMFGFKDAVINKNIKKSSAMLDDLESSKMEIVPLVVMLAKEYQAVYNIKLMSDKRLSNDQISLNMNGMHPYRVKLLREAGSKYTTDELESIILYLCNLDLKIVSEDNLGYDELRKFLCIL
jgi:DNA polymerase III delta subunit